MHGWCKQPTFNNPRNQHVSRTYRTLFTHYHHGITPLTGVYVSVRLFECVPFVRLCERAIDCKWMKSRNTGAKASSPVTLSEVGSSDAAGNATHLFANRSGRWGCGSCAYETLFLDLSPGQAIQAFLEYAFQLSIRNPRVRDPARASICTLVLGLLGLLVQKYKH